MTAAWMNGSQSWCWPVARRSGDGAPARCRSWITADRVVGTKLAATATSRVDRRGSPRRLPGCDHSASGPAFVDIPLDAFGPADVDLDAIGAEAVAAPGANPASLRRDAVARVAKLVSKAQRPVLLAA